MYLKRVLMAWRIPALAGVAAMMAVSMRGSVEAQARPSTPPYPLILTAQRALALVRAADRKLNYVPGEVLVKFRNGVTAVGQERALTSLRSAPSVTDLRWLGDVALLNDQSEPDSTILAARLNAQPEVLRAEQIGRASCRERVYVLV